MLSCVYHNITPASEANAVTRVNFAVYRVQVCGNARVWGDGIIPIEAAHLDGQLSPCNH